MTEARHCRDTGSPTLRKSDFVWPVLSLEFGAGLRQMKTVTENAESGAAARLANETRPMGISDLKN